jgi:membrane-bound metal-dependent hydrolase YbcI (DUF457 family)
MWPWEHAAFGYLLCSVAARAAGRSPRTAAVLGALLGTQLPDLIDKPLAWGLGVFPTGHGAAHSVFAALAVAALAWRARPRDGTRSGPRQAGWLGLAIGYWSHLVGDAVDPLRSGGGVAVERLLWPLVTAEPYARDYGLARGLVYIGEFAVAVTVLEPAALASLIVPAAALALWVADGAPGLGTARRLGRAGRKRLLPPGGRR